MPHVFSFDNAFQPSSRAEWREWLQQNHTRKDGVWFVFAKKGSGLPEIGYAEAVEEALCWGWVDGKAQGIDTQRHALWMAPRKLKSAWSKPNKERIERMIAQGQMMQAGLVKIDEAKKTGAWDKLNDVDNLVIPDDLMAAFQKHSGSAENWEAFPKSAKQAILQWIGNAKRPETRQARIEETARLASENKRANQWVPPGKR